MPRRNRKPRGPPRRRGATVRKVPRGVPTPTNNLVRLSNTSLGASNNNGHVITSVYLPLHPGLGVNAGSSNASWGRQTIVGSVGLTYGMFTNMIVRRAKIVFTVTNLEAFPVVCCLCPGGSASYTTIGVSNYTTTLLSAVIGSKSVVLNSTNLPNDTRTFSLGWLDVATLEGVSPVTLYNQAYWSTASVMGTLKQLIVCQLFATDGTTLLTGAGFKVSAMGLFDIEPVNLNPTLTQ